MAHVALLLLIGTMVGLSCCFGAKPPIERIARPLTVVLLIAAGATYALSGVTHA